MDDIAFLGTEILLNLRTEHQSSEMHGVIRCCSRETVDFVVYQPQPLFSFFSSFINDTMKSMFSEEVRPSSILLGGKVYRQC